MGWLYMHRAGMGGFDTPKAYLDNQLTWERENEETGTFEGCRVIRSVSTTGSYYAAVQRYGPNNQTHAISAVICLVRWNPKAADGLPFGYKDMDENSGPVEAGCPRSILEELGPTNHPYALDWRNRCYRHLRLKERKIADGDMIRLPEPMKFTDGSEHAEFRVTKCGAKIELSTPDGRGRFRISRLMERGSKSCPPSVRRAYSSRQRRNAREVTMLLQSLDPRRAILCGRTNAERLAIRMTANSGQSHAVGEDGQQAPALLCYACRRGPSRCDRAAGCRPVGHLGHMGLLPFITCSRLQLYQYQYNVPGKDEAMDVITYSEARANLKGIMDQVVSDRTHVVVTRQKAESIVMVSLEDWNAIEETMYLLSNRTNSDRLRQSIEQLDGQGGNERGLIEP